MSYRDIFNPITKYKKSIFDKNGQKILKKYLKKKIGGSDSDSNSDVDFFAVKLPPTCEPINLSADLGEQFNESIKNIPLFSYVKMSNITDIDFKTRALNISIDSYDSAQLRLNLDNEPFLGESFIFTILEQLRNQYPSLDQKSIFIVSFSIENNEIVYKCNFSDFLGTKGIKGFGDASGYRNIKHKITLDEARKPLADSFFHYTTHSEINLDQSSIQKISPPHGVSIIFEIIQKQLILYTHKILTKSNWIKKIESSSRIKRGDYKIVNVEHDVFGQSQLKCKVVSDEKMLNGKKGYDVSFISSKADGILPFGIKKHSFIEKDKFKLGSWFINYDFYINRGYGFRGGLFHQDNLAYTMGLGLCFNADQSLSTEFLYFTITELLNRWNEYKVPFSESLGNMFEKDISGIGFLYSELHNWDKNDLHDYYCKFILVNEEQKGNLRTVLHTISNDLIGYELFLKFTQIKVYFYSNFDQYINVTGRRVLSKKKLEGGSTFIIPDNLCNHATPEWGRGFARKQKQSTPSDVQAFKQRNYLERFVMTHKEGLQFIDGIKMITNPQYGIPEKPTLVRESSMNDNPVLDKELGDTFEVIPNLPFPTRQLKKRTFLRFWLSYSRSSCLTRIVEPLEKELNDQPGKSFCMSLGAQKSAIDVSAPPQVASTQSAPAPSPTPVVKSHKSVNQLDRLPIPPEDISILRKLQQLPIVAKIIKQAIADGQMKADDEDPLKELLLKRIQIIFKRVMEINPDLSDVIKRLDRCADHLDQDYPDKKKVIQELSNIEKLLKTTYNIIIY